MLKYCMMKMALHRSSHKENTALINSDLLQLAVFGFATGLGTTFGTEIAKEAMQHIKKIKKQVEVCVNA